LNSLEIVGDFLPTFEMHAPASGTIVERLSRWLRLLHYARRHSNRARVAGSRGRFHDDDLHACDESSGLAVRSPLDGLVGVEVV
jgi:hypothetical protein